MSSIKFLLFVWIPLTNSLVIPSSNGLISKNLSQSSASSHLNASNEAGPGLCESGWTYFDKTAACYKTFLDANAYDAEYICNALGGHLTSIHSLAENIFVAELARTGRPWKDAHDLTWIGLWAKGTGSKVWAWTDGTKVDYLDWIARDPQAHEDQRCVLLYSDNRLDSHYPPFYQKWDDYICAEKERSFVCKKTALHHITELHIRAITD
ncbi:unnamed protein product [Cylicocyclus nassatus]|uniref:C-type lectin domain-containing protein n=1 Tax=Cylicocyclus nassatus TaxID=53992 RepID=A0AA36DLS2_CYLNA|nr:unnamed protein product [Cylicocyclus nassatus]